MESGRTDVRATTAGLSDMDHRIVWDSYEGLGAGTDEEDKCRSNANVRCACGAMGRRVEIELHVWVQQEMKLVTAHTCGPARKAAVDALDNWRLRSRPESPTDKTTALLAAYDILAAAERACPACKEASR